MATDPMFSLGASIADLLGGGPSRRAEGVYVDQINKNAVAAGNWQDAVKKRAMNTALATITPQLLAEAGFDTNAAPLLATVLQAGGGDDARKLGDWAAPGYFSGQANRRAALDAGDFARYNAETAYVGGKDYQPTRELGGAFVADGATLADVARTAVMTPETRVKGTELEADDSGRLWQINPDGTGRAVSFGGESIPLGPPSRSPSPVLESALGDAVKWVESRGNPNAVRPKGAIGTMQTMPNTLRDPGYGVTPARDNSPAELERVGRDYLAAMQRQYGLEGGLAAYNWGPGNWEAALSRSGGDVRRALQSAPAETRKYVPTVLERAGTLGGVAGETLAASGGGPTFSGRAKGRESPETYAAPQEVLDPTTGRTKLVRFGSRGSVQEVSGYAPKPAATKAAAGPKPLGAEAANKVGLYDNALRAAKKWKDMVVNADGSFNDIAARLPSAKSLLAEAIRAKLRAESGASISPAELEGEVDRYMGGWLSSDKTNSTMAQTLVDDLATQRDVLMTGQSGGAAPSPAAASAPRRLKFNPATGRIE